MQGGLVEPTEERGGAVSVTSTGGGTEQADRTQPLTTTATVTGTSAFESHLDSFFEQSGWTREDAETMLTALNTVLFLALLYVEVNR